VLNTTLKVERFLQKQRFKKVLPYLRGKVLDFGGNEGELQPFVNGDYYLVNNDYALLEQKKPFDVIVSLAVIEHITPDEVKSIFYKFKAALKPEGLILLTTPSPASKRVLEILAFTGLLDKENIKEHKHYWTKSELYELANSTGFNVELYKKFQFGFNQFIKLSHKK